MNIAIGAIVKSIQFQNNINSQNQQIVHPFILMFAQSWQSAEFGGGTSVPYWQGEVSAPPNHCTARPRENNNRVLGNFYPTQTLKYWTTVVS